MSKKHTPDSLASMIREFAAEVGVDRPGRAAFVRRHGISTSTIQHHGGWNTLVALAVGGTPNEPPAGVVVPGDRSDGDVRSIERRENFLVTSAVNNCRADPGFLAACRHWKRETGGAIVVNPILYMNRERLKQDDGDVWWDPALGEYMLNREIRPHPKLSIMPTKVQATTNNPLPPRLDGRTKNRSAIFGHPQLMMRTVPTLDVLPKVMWSSGAITEKHYSDTLTGDIAEFHHGHSAIIAEVRGDRLYMRNVTWDGETFIDCENMYTADGIEAAPRPHALVMGDIHVGLHSDTVMEATFGFQGIYDVMGHEHLVVHDLADMKSCNPHEARNRLSRAALSIMGQTGVANELLAVAQFLSALPHDAKVRVVRSNHDDFLLRWLQGGEQYVEPENRKLYHKLSYEILDHIENSGGKWPIALELAVRDNISHPDVEFLDYDQRFTLGNVEMGCHGHLGPNGAKGTIRNYSRLGVRTMIGHGHGPGIFQGADMVGHSSEPRHGYNKGPSGWHQGHASLHRNGRRQMHLILPDGSWRG